MIAHNFMFLLGCVDDVRQQHRGCDHAETGELDWFGNSRVSTPRHRYDTSRRRSVPIMCCFSFACVVITLWTSAPAKSCCTHKCTCTCYMYNLRVGTMMITTPTSPDDPVQSRPCQQSTTTMQVTWTEFVDPESPIMT